MELIVKSREKVIFRGEVDNVSSYNKIGLFNILKNHSNFISIIEKKLAFKQMGATQEIPVEHALMKVTANKVFVYQGIK